MTKHQIQRTIQLLTLVALTALPARHTAGQCIGRPSGIVGWWPGDGHTKDIAGNNHGNNQPYVAFVSAKVASGFQFTSEVGWIKIPASPQLTVQSFTLLAWINPSTQANQMPIFEYEDPNNGRAGVHLWINVNGPGSLYGNIRDTATGDHYLQSANNAVPANSWTLVALTYDYSSGTAKLFVNNSGAVATSVFTPHIVPLTSYPLHLGRRTPCGDGSASYYGLIDEAMVFNRPLQASEIASIYAAGNYGICKPLCVNPLDAGLVGWWPLELNGQDASTSGHNAILSGVPFWYGISRYGIWYAQNSGEIAINNAPGSPLNVQSLTIAAWIRPNDVSVQRPIVEYVDPALTYSGVHLWLAARPNENSPGGLYANIMNEYANDYSITSGEYLIEADKWYFVAVTYDAGTKFAALYINGTVAATTTFADYIGSVGTGYPILIGHRPQNSGEGAADRRFLGQIDEVQIYNEALGGPQIGDLYRAGLCP